MSSASNEGRQSPPPESQTGAQLHDAPASGQGTDKVSNKGESMQEQVKNLSSNPKGPIDDAVENKFSKTSSESKDSK
ncbi:hypothetical protein F4780DRAFT_767019 [Xylariomycetidae sp. FL0641]|nr:hypothetical protein F4780DRAFT_767019 [Xylariomycetidae sp. FL0641]